MWYPSGAPPRRALRGHAKYFTGTAEAEHQKSRVIVFRLSGDAWGIQRDAETWCELAFLYPGMQFNNSDQSSDTPASVRAARAATRRAVRVGRRAESIGASLFDPP